VGTISKYLSDTSFLEKTSIYLKTCYGVRSILVNENGRTEPLNDGVQELPVARYYPINFEVNIGGIRCSAETEAALQSAEPHILYCVDVLQEILLKDWILKQTADEMLELSSQLHFLLNLAKKVIGIQNLLDYCRLTLEEISDAVKADWALAYIKGKHSNKDLLIHRGFDRSRASEFQKKISALHRPSDSDTFITSLDDGTSALVAPIREKESQAGFMAFFKSPEKRFFTSYEKKFIGIVDNIISPTVEGLKLYESLQEVYLNTVKALAKAIDAKDPYTYDHSSRVAKYAMLIGRQLNVPQEKLKGLESAAFMHDLGKTKVPESILLKPGRLTQAEFEEVKKHPLLTDKILEPINLDQYIVDAAVQHHERLNGRGYPLGLSGNAISHFARIIAVADVFDALTSTRHYRNAMTVEDALTILYEGIDTDYDRNVVLALVSALQNEKDDQELAKQYPELQFFKIEQMNHFLKKMTGLLLSGSQKQTALTQTLS
jgi:HD-GYP domain-containing protein (c-di-GMP phosphodiesterase class II)